MFMHHVHGLFIYIINIIHKEIERDRCGEVTVDYSTKDIHLLDNSIYCSNSCK